MTQIHKHSIGKIAEKAVAEYCKKKSYLILGQNIRIRGVECDLLVKTHTPELWLLEVKTLNKEAYLERRVHPNQIRRLRGALSYLIDTYTLNCRGHLVLVNKNHELTWHYDFLTF